MPLWILHSRHAKLSSPEVETGGSQIFSSQTPEAMVVAIKAYLNSLDK